ncbi:hypothetical protein NLM16_19665 [Bradyrhizobium brasilense]|uniref:hypothetical protein n=1 Tax=Bradyrhizobium brasilense TaxID=1419277 RepID=UPI002877D8D5|nr:hypothetical protein [Bradyrhizobium brasilense]MCP3416313.1 hypothetical protein [Bradyrhizobium brasilense]
MLGDVLRNFTSGAASLARSNGPESPISETGVPKSTDMAAALQIDAHVVAHEKHRNYKCLKEWSEWQDSNLRPLRPERNQRPKKSTKTTKLDPD